MTEVEQRSGARMLPPTSRRALGALLVVGARVTLRDHPWHECRRVGRVVEGPCQRINSLGRPRTYWAVQWEGRPRLEWVAGARLQATSGDERRTADG